MRGLEYLLLSIGVLLLLLVLSDDGDDVTGATGAQEKLRDAN